jgi:hypothetical protein
MPMRFLRRLFGTRRPVPAPPEHAVIAHLALSDDEFGSAEERDSIHELSTELERCIRDAGVGECDGDEIGGGECTLYMYGTDADLLFSAVERRLRAFAQAKGGFIIKRYGAASDPASREVRVDLSRVKQNVEDDFYVVDQQCLLCTVCIDAAPGLMELFEAPDGPVGSTCFFSRQPKTVAEVEAAILALSRSCGEAIRYRGHDPVILDRLAALGLEHLCDESRS